MMRARPAAHNQADLIGSLVRRHGAEVPITDIVRTSWSRCLNNFALDPQETRRPNSVERADLQARRERLGVLLSIARIEMEALGKLIKHSEYSIMLTDRDGVILTYVGDTGFSATARRCGFREGVMWSEREMGTNGMGTCLTARRPVVIHRTDHFLAQNTALTCSAAPIFDMRGELLAALDISGASANPQSHTLALVDWAAQNVENRTLLSAACKDLHLVRFHRCAEFVSTPGEGLLAFDDEGVVRGANRAALKLLGQREHDAVCGQRADRILDTSLATLLQLAAQRPVRGQRCAGQGPGHKRADPGPGRGQALVFQLPVGLEHRVRVDRQPGRHVLDLRQLVTLVQEAQPQRLPHLVDQLQVRRDAGPAVQVELDHRNLTLSRCIAL